MKLGAIGYGLMGSSILKGLVNSGTLKAEDILVSGHSEKTRARIKADGFAAARTKDKARQGKKRRKTKPGINCSKVYCIH